MLPSMGQKIYKEISLSFVNDTYKTFLFQGIANLNIACNQAIGSDRLCQFYFQILFSLMPIKDLVNVEGHCCKCICHKLLAGSIIVQSSFLAHLVMSLCNHAPPIMRCCHCHCRCHQCCWCQHLCTALPVTPFIIGTSYLANICSYTFSICT